MLPFLDKKKMAGLIMEKRGQNMAVGGEVLEANEGGESYAMKMCMMELLHAIERKEPVAMAKAFEEAFELLEMMPHVEAEHEGMEGLE